MIKITFKNQILEVPVGTMILDLLTEDEKTNYAVCMINEQVKELRFKLSEKNDGAVIKLCGPEYIEGSKAYEASLRLLISMAFHNIYPELSIRLSYNASRSIYCEIESKQVHLTKVYEDVKKEMNRIVKENIPIERITVTTEEAINIYKKMGHFDKIDIIKYIATVIFKY